MGAAAPKSTLPRNNFRREVGFSPTLLRRRGQIWEWMRLWIKYFFSRSAMVAFVDPLII